MIERTQGILKAFGILIAILGLVGISFYLISMNVDMGIIILVDLFLGLVLAGLFLRDRDESIVSRFFHSGRNPDGAQNPPTGRKKSKKIGYDPDMDKLRRIGLDHKYRKPLTRKCPKCGILLASFIKKCPHCGERVRSP